MRLYRIAKAAHARDLSGEGARLFGGRWTAKGYPALYTSEHPALAAWEVAVRFDFPLEVAPLDHRMVTLQIPEPAAGSMTNVDALPHDPVAIGTDWLEKGSSLLLRVPSVVVPDSYNVLINARHPDMDQVRIESCAVFAFDSRLAREP